MNFLLLLALVFSTTTYAAESNSFLLQDEFPNYGSNTQVSNTFSLQGDTTWHQQPNTSDSFVLNITATPFSSSSVSSTVSSVASVNTGNGSGLRGESIEARNNPIQEQVEQVNPEPVEPTDLRPAADEKLEFNPNAPIINLYTGDPSNNEKQVQQPVAYNPPSKVVDTIEPQDPVVEIDTNTNAHTHCTEPLHGAAEEVSNVYFVTGSHNHFHFYEWLNDVLLLVVVITLLAIIILMHRKITTLEQLLVTKKKKKRTVSFKKRTVKK